MSAQKWSLPSAAIELLGRMHLSPEKLLRSNAYVRTKNTDFRKINLTNDIWSCFVMVAKSAVS